jgi:hypothetical protein
MPSLQDLEDLSEDEYETELSLPLDPYTKPLESYDEQPLLPTLASTISPDLGPCSPDQALSATLGRSPTPEFQHSTQALRKRKRRDLNAA